MKTRCAYTFYALLRFFVGCTTSINSRISRNRAQFNGYTSGEKRMIQAGQVPIDVNQDRVYMALGNPSSKITVATAKGKQTMLEYGIIKPRFGMNIDGGINTDGNGIRIGTGIDISPKSTKLLKDIVFDRQTGKVPKVESYN